LEFSQNGEKNTEKDVAVDIMSDNVLFPLSSSTGSKEQDLGGDLTPKAPASARMETISEEHPGHM